MNKDVKNGGRCVEIYFGFISLSFRCFRLSRIKTIDDLAGLVYLQILIGACFYNISAG